MTERAIDNIHLEKKDLVELFRPVFSDLQKVEHFELLSGGAINTTYKVIVDSVPYVLRLYLRQRALAVKEKEILEWLDTISTPRLLYSDPQHEPWAYAIFEYVEGVSIANLDQSQASSLSAKLGKLLADIHAFSFPKAGLMDDAGATISTPFPKDSSPYYEPTVQLLLNSDRVRSRLGQKLADQALAFIDTHKSYFPRIDNDISLVHSDFKPVNLLYDTHGNLFVVDWEFAHAGKAILDFGILLRHQQQFPCDLKALKEAYLKHGGKLDAEWIKSALITDFVNIAFLLDVEANRPELYQFLKERLLWTLEHWGSANEKTLKSPSKS